MVYVQHVAKAVPSVRLVPIIASFAPKTPSLTKEYVLVMMHSITTLIFSNAHIVMLRVRHVMKLRNA